jgi:hypothetical protein
MDAILPLDANNLDVEEAISRLFVYLRTGGRPIVRTDNPVFTKDTEDAETPRAVIDAILASDGHHIGGVTDEERRELIATWLESHFALMARRGKSKGGDYRMSGLRPLHFCVIKLFNPRVNRQDRYLSDFLFNVFQNDEVLYRNPDSLFKQFFGLGVKFHGDKELRVDEPKLTELANAKKLDIELLFLLRLTEPFEVDKFSTRKEDVVSTHSFLCSEQIEMLRRDLQLLFMYREFIPRRELINYMTTLMVFHIALYFFQIVKIVNHASEKKSLPDGRGTLPEPGAARTHAPFDLNIFCDLSNGHDPVAKDLSERCFIDLFKEVETYFRSAYTFRKLEEFASSYLDPKQRQQKGRDYIKVLLDGFLKHPDLNGHFNRDIQSVVEASRDEETGEVDPDLQRVLDICNQRGLNKLQTFVEILLHFQYGTLREQHRKLISGLCGVDQERGFIAGKGRAKRRFVLGNELIEVLIQLAVLRKRASDGKFETRPVPIREFVDWLAGRYGILVDRLNVETGVKDEREHINRALTKNYDALKTRLRQLGFFTDLADASNSQVIAPRFKITHGEI